MEEARHLILASFVIVTLGLVQMLRVFGHDRAMSLSEHAARHQASYRLFVVSLLVAMATFYAGAFLWIGPTLQLGWPFYVLLGVILPLLIATALVPDREGRSRRVHRTAAWSMAALCQVLLLYLVLSTPLKLPALAVVWAAIVSMTIAWLLFFFVPWARRHFLLVQSSYLVSFYLAMIAAAYSV